MKDSAASKRLIVTADDFGAGTDVNRAVVKAFREGILRYASLMVRREAAADAARLAKENPGLGVGVHVELCSEDPGAWGLRYFFMRKHRRRLEPEIRAQIEKFLSFGLKPTHLDSHFHLHVHPAIFPVMARLAKEYGIPRLRLPGGEARRYLGYGGARASQLGSAGVFALLGGGLKFRARGLVVPERSWGLLRSGLMSEDYLIWLLRRLPEGLTEIYFHPSDDPASAVTTRPTPTHSTITELRALISPRVREALSESGAALVCETPRTAA